MSYRMDRRAYAETFGPTVGDRVRLADTDLFIEVEQDYTTYGDEVKFGGGKVIRDGMGQSPISNADGAVDLVITNALILDWWGIVKADIGIKDGLIFKIGKPGNPYVQDNVDIIIGPGTEVLAGEGRIITADNLKRKGFSGPSRFSMCLNEEESIQHLFLDCPFTRECWKQLSSPLEMELNFSITFNDFFFEWKKKYPYSMKNKKTIKRFWESLPSFLCQQIWISRNKIIFKDQIPKIGRVLSKTWGH